MQSFRFPASGLRQAIPLATAQWLGGCIFLMHCPVLARLGLESVAMQLRPVLRPSFLASQGTTRRGSSYTKVTTTITRRSKADSCHGSKLTSSRSLCLRYCRFAASSAVHAARAVPAAPERAALRVLPSRQPDHRSLPACACTACGMMQPASEGTVSTKGADNQSIDLCLLAFAPPVVRCRLHIKEPVHRRGKTTGPYIFACLRLYRLWYDVACK